MWGTRCVERTLLSAAFALALALGLLEIRPTSDLTKSDGQSLP
jgi:hypothetical protein